jgi:hypothetical protein
MIPTYIEEIMKNFENLTKGDIPGPNCHDKFSKMIISPSKFVPLGLRYEALDQDLANGSIAMAFSPTTQAAALSSEQRITAGLADKSACTPHVAAT